jgi:hypothetical protein
MGPVPDHRSCADPQHLGHLLVAEAREEPELHEPGLARVDLRQALEGVVQVEELLRTEVVRRAQPAQPVEGHAPPLPSPLGTGPFSGVVDENPPHHRRSHGQEVGSALPAHLLLVGEPEECLVHHSGRLQRVTLALTGEVSPSDPPQLVVNLRPHAVSSGCPGPCRGFRQTIGTPGVVAVVLSHFAADESLSPPSTAGANGRRH